MDSTNPRREREIRKLGAAMDSLLAQVAMLQRDTPPEQRGHGYRADLAALQARVTELNRERARLAAQDAMAEVAAVRALAAQLLSAAAAIADDQDTDVAALVLEVYDALEPEHEAPGSVGRAVDELARDVALGVALGRARRTGTARERLAAAADVLAAESRGT